MEYHWTRQTKRSFTTSYLSTEQIKSKHEPDRSTPNPLPKLLLYSSYNCLQHSESLLLLHTSNSPECRVAECGRYAFQHTHLETGEIRHVSNLDVGVWNGLLEV